MSDLETGRLLGAAQAQLIHHERRLDKVEADLGNIRTRIQDVIWLFRRAGLVVVLWGVGTLAGIASPQLGEMLAQFIRTVLIPALIKL